MEVVAASAAFLRMLQEERMLIELFGQNFGCFRDEFRLSLLASDIDPDSPRGVIDVKIDGDEEPLRLLRCVAIYGPNASGKSTVLRAAAALGYLIEASAHFSSDEPLAAFSPFWLEARFRSEPVTLGVRGVIDRLVYEYVVRFNESEVIEESLKHIQRNDAITLFHRNDRKVEGQWESHQQFALIRQDFRSNALLLSLADAVAPSLARGVAVGLRQLLGHYDPTLSSRLRTRDPVAQRVAIDASFGDWLRSRLRVVDIGVGNYQLDEVVEGVRRYPSDADPEGSRPKSFRLALLHDAADGPTRIPGGRESQGTRRFLDLAPYFFDVAQGSAKRAFFVDEIDASLHPALLSGLIHHINSELTDERVRGQLIFATHETELIDDQAKEAILRRDQVYFTEKDSAGAARLYSLAEFKDRNNVNMRRRYLQGRYGALPSLGDFTE